MPVPHSPEETLSTLALDFIKISLKKSKNAKAKELRLNLQEISDKRPLFLRKAELENNLFYVLLALRKENDCNTFHTRLNELFNLFKKNLSPEEWEYFLQQQVLEINAYKKFITHILQYLMQYEMSIDKTEEAILFMLDHNLHYTVQILANKPCGLAGEALSLLLSQASIIDFIFNSQNALDVKEVIELYIDKKFIIGLNEVFSDSNFLNKLQEKLDSLDPQLADSFFKTHSAQIYKDAPIKESKSENSTSVHWPSNLLLTNQEAKPTEHLEQPEISISPLLENQSPKPQVPSPLVKIVNRFLIQNSPRIPQKLRAKQAEILLVKMIQILTPLGPFISIQLPLELFFLSPNLDPALKTLVQQNNSIKTSETKPSESLPHSMGFVIEMDAEDEAFFYYMGAYLEQMRQDLKQFIRPITHLAYKNSPYEFTKLCITKVQNFTEKLLEIVPRTYKWSMEQNKWFKLENCSIQKLLEATTYINKEKRFVHTNAIYNYSWNHFISLHLETINYLQSNALPLMFRSSLKKELPNFSQLLQHSYLSLLQTPPNDHLVYNKMKELTLLIDNKLNKSGYSPCLKLYEHGSQVAYRLFPEFYKVRADMDIRLSLSIKNQNSAWKPLIAEALKEFKAINPNFEFKEIIPDPPYPGQNFDSNWLLLLKNNNNPNETQEIDLTISSLKTHEDTLGPRVFPAAMLAWDIFENTLFNPRGSLDKQVLFSHWIFPQENLDTWMKKHPKVAYILRFMAKMNDIFLDRLLLEILKERLLEIMNEPSDKDKANPLQILFSKKSLHLAGFHNLVLTGNLYFLFDLDINKDTNFMEWINNFFLKQEIYRKIHSSIALPKISIPAYLSLLFYHLQNRIITNQNEWMNLRCLIEDPQKAPNISLAKKEIEGHLSKIEEDLNRPYSEPSSLVCLFYLRDFYQNQEVPAPPYKASRDRFFMPKNSAKHHPLPAPEQKSSDSDYEFNRSRGP